MNAWHSLSALAPAAPSRPLAERQMDWLRACLQRNADCESGRAHGFAAIHSPEDYQSRVPQCDYEALRAPIARMAAGAADILFAGSPLAFERTGGSSSGAKLIPYSADSLLDFRRALLGWLHTVINAYGLQQGCAYWALSPATRAAEATSGGIPIGLPDGAYFGAEAGAAFASLSAVPFSLAAQTDVARWQSETLYWLLRRADLALISVWSPSFFTALLDALPLHADHLLQQLRADDPDAAARLEAWLISRDAHTLWPALRLISAWADGSSRPWADALRQRLPQAAFQPKGLLSTEAVVTIPDAQDRPVLAADSGFHEFIDAGGVARFAWQLREGERYDVLLTTSGGLYRYRSGDRVECRGHVGNLPVLHFIGRSGLSSDLVGEKLTDDFVADCLADMPGFRMLLPQPERPGYLLLHDAALSPDLKQLEARLSRNPQYAYALRIGQLKPLVAQAEPAALSRFVADAVSHGQRLGDVKLPALCLNARWLSPQMET